MKPTLEEVKQLKDYNIIPVCIEIFSDFTTPIEVLKKLKGISKKNYLLESVSSGKWSRYSFLGYDPILEISCKDNIVSIDKDGKIESYRSENPIDEIRKITSKYKSPQFDYMPSFTGGLVGYFSYDIIQYVEPTIKFKSLDEACFKDYHFMLFNKVIAFDNLKQKIVLITNINTNNIEYNYEKAKEELKELVRIIKDKTDYKVIPNKIKSPIVANDNIIEYSKKIDKIKDYIKNGDIFQCVLSRRFKGKMTGDLFNTYRVLRTLNPSPYMIYLDMGELQIAGASPETLVKKEGSLVQTFPIAGTRKRGVNDLEDFELEKELLNDPKELAEHNMLVDLGRNDVGKISKISSVKVINYQHVMKFSHVMHITSTVSGTIKENLDSIDALKVILPAGTLSGAPKIRACQIIDELEDTRRGIYGGSMGYIDFSGNMDMCIVIRTAIKKGDDVYVQAGGGIVLDSDHLSEYQETENKAFAMLKAINLSEGEII